MRLAFTAIAAKLALLGLQDLYVAHVARAMLADEVWRDSIVLVALVCACAIACAGLLLALD